eukprot:5299990-Prymnesium_polylepis.2
MAATSGRCIACCFGTQRQSKRCSSTRRTRAKRWSRIPRFGHRTAARSRHPDQQRTVRNGEVERGRCASAFGESGDAVGARAATEEDVRTGRRQDIGEDGGGDEGDHVEAVHRQGGAKDEGLTSPRVRGTGTTGYS